MGIAVVGLSHKTTPVEVRERLAFPEKDQERAVRELLARPGVSEAIIISTCNRVEIYASGDDERALPEALASFMGEYHGFPLETLRAYLYSLHGADAVRHVMRVSASLDSMVVGEPQILGQVKDAYQKALDCGSTGNILNKLMKKTFSVAKQVRTDTGIARSAVSISFAAVELARKIFDDLTGKTVMLIGAGEMSELAARHLVNQGVRDVLVANRTFERAVELAREFNGSAVKFEDLAEQLVITDIVISSTGAPHFILTPEMMRTVIDARRNRPIFLIDIAVPRDIDPRVNELDNVYLYDIDNLQTVVDANRKEREKESTKAEEIIDREIKAFIAWLDTLQVVPVIVALREKVEAIREAELAKALARLPDLSPKDAETVKALASGIVNKILHEPITRLKAQSAESRPVPLVEAVRELFGIHPRGKETEKYDGATDG